MEQAIAARTPVHLWIVGGLATLWNAFGAFDYTMTNTLGADYIASMMPGANAEAMMTWIESFPLWAHAAWALGVWGSLVGSILLLMRNRFALQAYIVSLLGALVSFGYQYTSANPPPEGADAGAMPIAIISLVIAQLAYSAQMRKRGVLR